ncbi:MAG: VWA domain-containing protein [Deltaproteobacteria bacterium]|nr:VWA domain-containing protein [Deltaproteobacteria bacterium]
METEIRRHGLFFVLWGLMAAGALIFHLFSAIPASGSSIGLEVKPENRTILVPGDGSGNILIRITAPDDLGTPDRPLLNMALVLDKSGSMSDQGKIEFARLAAHQLIDRLGPSDILSIVTYDDRVRVLSPAGKVKNRARLHRIIDSIYPGGRTYLSGGLEKGFEQARRSRRKGYVNRVLLLSDGLANVGNVNRDLLRIRAGSMSESGVSVSTFGVGYDFDEDLLASLATGGGGSYYYIADPRDIVAALSKEFQMASATVATDVQIIIRLLNGCRFDSAIGHEWRRDGDSVIIRLGDMSAGERRSLMARVNVPGKELGDQRVADVYLQYRDTASGRMTRYKPHRVSLRLVQDPMVYRNNFDDKIREEGAVLQSNARMKDAAARVDQGDREGALGILKEAAKALKSVPATEATKKELEKNGFYQNQIGGMDSMEADEVKQMQKGVKYRAYRELNQQ